MDGWTGLDPAEKPSPLRASAVLINIQYGEENGKRTEVCRQGRC